MSTPDIEVARYALRTFNVHNDRVESLSVAAAGTHWLDGVCVAKCTLGHKHEVPHDGCSCGIYGTLNVPALRRQYAYQANRLIAVMAVEGKTIIGDTGLRTAAARIVAYWVFTPDSGIREVCEARLGGAQHFEDLGKMLEVYKFPPAQNPPVSKIVLPFQAAGTRFYDVPAHVTGWEIGWWRQRLYDWGGQLFTTEYDDLEKPTECTISWCDPDAAKDETVRPYAARITTDHRYNDIYTWGGSVIATVLNSHHYLDVLWHEPPTSGPWHRLTELGQLTHPDDRARK